MKLNLASRAFVDLPKFAKICQNLNLDVLVDKVDKDHLIFWMMSELARRLLVRALPANVTYEFLKQFFGEVGTIESISPPTIELESDRKGRQSYAFVTYESHDDAKRAIAMLNYTKLNGVPIRISWADPKTRPSEKSKLIIKNLDPDIEASQLRDVFGNFGEVFSCEIATDADGKSLGYGYVHFMEQKDADQVMEDLEGATINGRLIQIEPYLKKTEPESERDTQGPEPTIQCNPA